MAWGAFAWLAGYQTDGRGLMVMDGGIMIGQMEELVGELAGWLARWPRRCWPRWNMAGGFMLG